MKIFGYFEESSQNWTIFRGHFYAYQGLYLRSMYSMGDIYFIFQILFWVLGIRDIFGVKVDAGAGPKYEENMRVPPPPPPRKPSFCCVCSVSVPVHCRFVQGERLNHYNTEVFLMAAPYLYRYST